VANFFVKPVLRKHTKDFTTTDNYASVQSGGFLVRGYRQKLIEIQNKHSTNALLWKALASNDGSIWHEIQAEATLAANTPAKTTNDEPWDYIDVQVRASVAGSQANGTVIIQCSTL